MEFFTNIWKNIGSLHSLSGFLQWFSIILIFIGGFSQIAKQVVDRREKYLSDKITTEKESLHSNQELVLKQKVTNLENDLGTKLKVIEKLKEEAKYTDPYAQPIHSGSAKVVVTIQTSENIDSHFMDRGAYVAFGKGGQAIMVMNSIDSFGKSNGNNTATYNANVMLDANDVSIGKIVKTLKETEFVQLSFSSFPAKSIVLGGSVICTINGIVRLEVKIPPQQMSKDFIIANDLKGVFKDFK